jgi:TM2 domain-containing membrane protein YozV
VLEQEEGCTSLKSVYHIRRNDPWKDNRHVAALLAIVLGGLGIHKFYMRKPLTGSIQAALFLSVFVPFGVVAFAVAMLALIEGVMYMRQSDTEFVDRYIYGNKQF